MPEMLEQAVFTDDNETTELHWPGDLLTVPTKLRITHEMLGIKKSDQATLVGRAEAGGEKGLEARVKLLTIQKVLWQAFEELDLYRDPATKRLLSRWVPPPAQTYVKGMEHGQSDDFQTFFEKNFNDYFRRMEVLDLAVLGMTDRERLAKMNLSPEIIREQVTNSDRYVSVGQWCKSAMEKAEVEARAELGGELPKRLTVAERASGVKRGRPQKATRAAAVTSDSAGTADMGGVIGGQE